MTNRWNWARTRRVLADQWIKPTSQEELREKLRTAMTAGRRIMTVGKAFSFSGCIRADDAAVDLSGLNGVLVATRPSAGGAPGGDRRMAAALSDAAWADQSIAGLAFVGAGARIFDLCEAGRSLGLAPLTLGGSSGQTVIGAMSTGTHGADFDLGPLCEQVVALHITNGDLDTWVERANANGSWTRDKGALDLVGLAKEPKRLRIVRSDSAFNAAVVALGAAGVIAGAVIKLRRDAFMNERVYVKPWTEVRSALVECSAFVRPPGELAGTGPGGTYRYLEIQLDPYATPTRCFVIARNEVPGDPPVGPRRLQRKSANLGGFATKLVTPGADLSDYSDALGTLILDSRLSGELSGTKEAWVLHRYLDVLDVGVPETQPVHTYEFVWPADECGAKAGSGKQEIPHYIAFLDESVRRLREDAAPFLGLCGVRFSRGTSALLGMQHSATPATTRFAQVELTSIQNIGNSNANYPRNVPYLKHMMRYARARGARLHWGLGSRFAAYDARIYPELAKWQKEVVDLAGPRADQFQSDFLRSANALP